VKEQLSLLETPLPTGAVPAWDALDAEQQALVVSTLSRLIAKVAVAGHERADAADKEKSDE
jgi:hypothetical protein